MTDYFMDLIIKYLNSDLNPDEAQKLVDWVNESNENKNKFLQYQDLWFAGNPAGSGQEKTLFAWEDFEGKIQWDGKGTIINLPDRKIRFLNTWYFKAAASFIFIIGIVRSIEFVKATDLFVQQEFLLERAITAFSLLFSQALVIAFPILGTLILLSVTTVPSSTTC